MKPKYSTFIYNHKKFSPKKWAAGSSINTWYYKPNIKTIKNGTNEHIDKDPSQGCWFLIKPVLPQSTLSTSEWQIL